jgi:minor extracellular serine protease Vpr
MLMFKKFMSFFVLFFMMFSLNYSSAQEKSSSRIDPSFLSEVIHTQEWVSVVIELRDEPSVEFWSKKNTVQNFEDVKIMQNALLTETSEYQNMLMSKQEAFLKSLHQREVKLIPGEHITLVLNALTAEIRGNDIPKLLEDRRILFVHDDRPKFQPVREIMASTTGSREAWNGFPDLGIPRLTGRNKLIGIIDTGLDKDHIEFNRPKKVRGGYNFVDGNSIYKDEEGHGTHVAGISAGQGKTEKFRGMAYEADLMAYRVFTPRQQGARNVIAAIDRSVTDKCDVINMSLGYAGGENSKGSTAYHRSIANASKAGVFVVVAIGNDGSRRADLPWTAGSPAIVEEAFSVAASNDRTIQASLVLTTQEASKVVIPAIQVSPTPLFTNQLLQKAIVPAGFGSVGELKDLDLKGKIALIQRGPLPAGITFREKLENAYAQGAEGVILYNHTSGDYINPSILDPARNETAAQVAYLPPTVMLSLEDGLMLKGETQKDYLLEVSYQNLKVIADFSSMGPTPDAAFKPEISAPGDLIFSTFPGGKYGNASGTSMASPSMAGLATLLKEARPKWDSKQIKSAFMNTAELLINPANNLPITFFLQGAGSARIDKAIATPAFIEPRALVFSNAPSEIEQVFTVSNATSQEQSFPLKYQIFLLEGETSPIEISFEQSACKLEPSKDSSFLARFKVDKKAFLRGRYEGIIQLGTQLHIPFVICRDEVSFLQDPISDIRLSSAQLEFSTQATEPTDSVLINFSLNAGTVATVPSGNSTANIGRNYGTVKIAIVDAEGEEWDSILTLNNIMVGEYSIPWNGRNRQNRYFLPKGSYFIKASMSKQVFDEKSRGWITKDYVEKRQAFSVVSSDVPDPITAVFSSFKTFREYEEFSLDLNFGNLSSLQNVASAVSSIEFELNYDSARLMYRRFVLNGFMKDKEKEYDFEIDEDDNNGIIKVKFHFDQMPLNSFLDQKSFSLVFRTIGSGRVRFAGKGFRLILDTGESLRVKPLMPSIRISSRDYLLADINNDKIVDRLDFVLFNEAFGSKQGDENFDANCDFNQDMKVDMSDMMIITREMGKMI